MMCIFRSLLIKQFSLSFENKKRKNPLNFGIDNFSEKPKVADREGDDEETDRFGGLNISECTIDSCRSQWPRGLRRRSTAVRLLRLWVRIPAGAWMFVVSVVCCQVEVSATD